MKESNQEIRMTNGDWMKMDYKMDLKSEANLIIEKSKPNN